MMVYVKIWTKHAISGMLLHHLRWKLIYKSTFWIKNMLMRCKITKKAYVLVEFSLKTLKPLKTFEVIEQGR